MRVLDLFCGAGGAAMGLHRAWPDAEIVGVDINPQPRYPFKFVQGDALHYLDGTLRGFDFIWASPPCQKYSIAGHNQRRDGKVYQDLVAVTRFGLEQSGKPWVIENVPGAPVRPDFILCGSQFGLPMARHRLFECSFANGLRPSCSHAKEIITVCGHGTPQWMRQSRIRKGLYPNISVEQKREAMGIDWMNRGELAQAVPPAYSQYIAEQFEAESLLKKEGLEP